MQTNIFAFTAPEAEYPEFVSINENGGRFEISVRGPKQLPTAPRTYALPGATVTAPLPRDAIPLLIAALRAYLEGPRPPSAVSIEE